MIKYFELLLSLLDIEESSRVEYIAVANKIELIWESSNSYSSLQCYHRHAFVFKWYQKLLNKKITTEEFTQIWDINSKISFDTKKQDSISFLKSNPVLDDNVLYIFDKISDWIVSEKNNVVYC